MKGPHIGTGCISLLVLLALMGADTVHTIDTGGMRDPLTPAMVVRPFEEALRHVKPKASPEDQEAAVKGLAQRLLKDRASEFSFVVDPSIGPEGKDTFQVVSPGVNASVDIKGTSGVAASWGLLHYLKYSCNSHVSWEADQISLPTPLPPAQINITSNDRFRYYQNVCTVSYSMVWWNWTRWEREIDWMAMNGFNIPLAFTGQEAIWQRVYSRLGITQQELDEHFAGPAFLAWGRMGNIRGWGGPLPQSWHDKTLALQHQILQRMRQFGMTPILPAFAGHVPSGLTRVFPTANVTRLDPWVTFNCTYSCTYLLDPSDQLFQKIGSDFLDEITKEFGTDHLYNCDTFNEMTPKSSDPAYLKSVGASIFDAMTSSDPDAIWVMQGWLFLNTGFWQLPQAKALLTSVPIGRMLILDLDTDASPQYSRLESYFGQPFIACMLHDFGGVDGFFGHINSLITNMVNVRKFPNVTVVGTGLTPEGINQNYVMYDFMNELAWRTQPPNVTSWVASYASRRYNSTDQRLAKAWQLLMGSVYVNEIAGANNGKYVIMQRPSITRTTDTIWYSVDDVVNVWDLFMEVIKGAEEFASQEFSGESEEEEIMYDAMQGHVRLQVTLGVTEQMTFLHDVVDVWRQMLQILSGRWALQMGQCYTTGDLPGVQKYQTDIQMILKDYDAILATSPDFLLGAWTEGAASWATNEKERELYVFNALNQVTTWGPDANILDYASKQWSGLISHYVAPRWELFGNMLAESLKNGSSFDQNTFNNQVFEQVEDPLAKNVNVTYESVPKGDTIAMALDLHSKYRPYFDDSSNLLTEQ